MPTPSKRRMLTLAVAASQPLLTPAALLGLDLAMHLHTQQRIFGGRDTFPTMDAALVPGALCYANGEPKPALADRLHTAAALLQAAKCGRIIVSGDDGARRQDEIGPMLAFLERLGVARADIVVDSGSFRTLDTMARVARMNPGGVAICSQRNHLPRCLYLADAAGLPAIGVISDRRRYRKQAYDRLYEMVGRSAAVVDVVVWRQMRAALQQPK